MYPFGRMALELWLSRNQPPLDLLGTHVSHHRCWPWDIDLWLELNNGRTLTLYDLGRIPLAKRAGLTKMLMRQRWGLTMAGVSVRYRRRIRAFEKIEMRSRCIGWDDRFVYLDQTMWKASGECAGQALYRSAVTDRGGIVTTDRVLEALGHDGPAPELPVWVKAWIDADATRPWPPEPA
ncbi:acyl-CoA thioesterase [Anianabacter salinae]|uniref:acyl-CoA thioesterase n=1 Tax=Anianabacter salinae TaxID=2851023 RepID=UPI00225DD18B|nr:acyl-CoA thioesterase [Anianabacter salinae]MBV0913411.1 acyl-CoA thioesterase [Anianabacter salinae]